MCLLVNLHLLDTLYLRLMQLQLDHCNHEMGDFLLVAFQLVAHKIRLCTQRQRPCPLYQIQCKILLWILVFILSNHVSVFIYFALVCVFCNIFWQKSIFCFIDWWQKALLPVFPSVSISTMILSTENRISKLSSNFTT